MIPPRGDADDALDRVTTTTPNDQGLLLELILRGAEDPAVAARLQCAPALCRLGLDILSWQKLKTRLPSLLPLGTKVAHKTGTGQVLGGVQAGYNDIGIITAPNGRSYAIAVMIKRTATPLITRMNLMNNIVRAVIDSHEASYGAGVTL